MPRIGFAERGKEDEGERRRGRRVKEEHGNEANGAARREECHRKGHLAGKAHLASKTRVDRRGVRAGVAKRGWSGTLARVLSCRTRRPLCHEGRRRGRSPPRSSRIRGQSRTPCCEHTRTYNRVKSSQGPISHVTLRGTLARVWSGAPPQGEREREAPAHRFTRSLVALEPCHEQQQHTHRREAHQDEHATTARAHQRHRHTRADQTAQRSRVDGESRRLDSAQARWCAQAATVAWCALSLAPCGAGGGVWYGWCASGVMAHLAVETTIGSIASDGAMVASLEAPGQADGPLAASTGAYTSTGKAPVNWLARASSTASATGARAESTGSVLSGAGRSSSNPPST
jgi:hypothetical protein